MRLPVADGVPVTAPYGVTSFTVSRNGKGYKALIDKEDLVKVAGHNKWYLSKRGDIYTQYQRTKNGKRHRVTLRLHRVIMDAPKNKEVDHINGSRLDNRKANLRVCSHKDNGKNLTMKKNNTSGITGVYWDNSRTRWFSSIKLEYKNIFLGYFKNKEDAALCRFAAETQLYKEFAPSWSRL